MIEKHTPKMPWDGDPKSATNVLKRQADDHDDMKNQLRKLKRQNSNTAEIKGLMAVIVAGLIASLGVTNLPVMLVPVEFMALMSVPVWVMKTQFRMDDRAKKVGIPGLPLFENLPEDLRGAIRHRRAFPSGIVQARGTSLHNTLVMVFPKELPIEAFNESGIPNAEAIDDMIIYQIRYANYISYIQVVATYESLYQTAGLVTSKIEIYQKLWRNQRRAVETVGAQFPPANYASTPGPGTRIHNATIESHSIDANLEGTFLTILEVLTFIFGDLTPSAVWAGGAGEAVINQVPEVPGSTYRSGFVFGRDNGQGLVMQSPFPTITFGPGHDWETLWPMIKGVNELIVFANSNEFFTTESEKLPILPEVAAGVGDHSAFGVIAKAVPIAPDLAQGPNPVEFVVSKKNGRMIKRGVLQIPKGSSAFKTIARLWSQVDTHIMDPVGTAIFENAAVIERDRSNTGGAVVAFADLDLPAGPVVPDDSTIGRWSEVAEERDARAVTAGPVTVNMFCSSVTAPTVQSFGHQQTTQIMMRGLPIEMAHMPAVPAILRGIDGPGPDGHPPARGLAYPIE